MYVYSSKDVGLTYGIQILSSELSSRNMQSRVPEEIGLFDVNYKKRCMFSEVNKNKQTKTLYLRRSSSSEMFTPEHGL